jgi:hypothetical protein
MEHTMATEKNRQEKDPQESGFFEDLTERVFKDYEPPKREDSVNKSEDEKKEGNERQQAA